jgi:hypothetical protein
MDDLTNLNLGQLVGRALYGKLERRPQPELVEAAEVARRAEEQRRAVELERAALVSARAASRSEASTARARRRSARTSRRPAPRLRSAARTVRPPMAARKRKAIKAPPAPHRIGTSAAIRALLAKHPEGLRSGEIAATLGIKVGLASAHLCTMSGVLRSGVRSRFVYRLSHG